MKSKYSDRNVNKVIEPCNEWACPCNEGLGCQGNMFCRTACENASLDEVSPWHTLMDEAFKAINTPDYDAACKKIYDFSERY